MLSPDDVYNTFTLRISRGENGKNSYDLVMRQTLSGEQVAGMCMATNILMEELPYNSDIYGIECICERNDGRIYNIWSGDDDEVEEFLSLYYLKISNEDDIVFPVGKYCLWISARYSEDYEAHTFAIFNTPEFLQGYITINHAFQDYEIISNWAPDDYNKIFRYDGAGNKTKYEVIL